MHRFCFVASLFLFVFHHRLIIIVRRAIGGAGISPWDRCEAFQPLLYLHHGRVPSPSWGREEIPTRVHIGPTSSEPGPQCPVA